MTRKVTTSPGRVRIPLEAGAELARRYRAEQLAAASLNDFLSGIVAALGIDPDRLRGFDDSTCELLLKDPEASDAT